MRTMERRLQYLGGNSPYRREGGVALRFTRGVEFVRERGGDQAGRITNPVVSVVGGSVVERVESRNIDLKMAQLIATAVALSFGVGITMGTMFVAFAALLGA